MGGIEDRFWSRVQPTGFCWYWTRGTNGRGYGLFWDGDRRVQVHRFAYELLIGPIPDGLVLDHLCRNTLCVNPDHLEAVTQAENLARRAVSTRAHCKRGHEFNEANTRIDARGWRTCRACARLRESRQPNGLA